MGIWAVGTTYSKDQCVEYSGAIYRSISNSNTGNTPSIGSSFWGLINNSAKDGDICIVNGTNSAQFLQRNNGIWVPISGGSSATGGNDDLVSLLFRGKITDTFTEAAGVANSTIATGSNTTATYLPGPQIYQISYDASKTLTLVTSTTATLSAAPAYTVQVGDVIVIGNQYATVSNVGTVNSDGGATTPMTINPYNAFPATATNVACCVSQKVKTVGLYTGTFGGDSLSTTFSAQPFSEVLIDYEDSSATNQSIFDIASAPVVAYAAIDSANNTTQIYTRQTLQTSTAQTIFLPTASTDLFIRFFANKTSGSGTVNLCRYRAYMIKDPTSAYGSQNSALGFTNNSATPYNCTIGQSSSGLTTVTLGFNYAVGVNSGAPYGSIDVLLNGQLLPRYINSTLTPDGSYTETSNNVITLDRDYSSLQLSIEVIQRVTVTDTSSQNTTNISSLQAIQNNGFQSFVNTSNYLQPTLTTGTPATGYFYSNIPNRAPIVDFTQDLKLRFGVERIMFQAVQRIENETDASGQYVYGVVGDVFGQVRCCGGWINNVSTNGSRINNIATSSTDYIEVTFYGTGLNLLCLSGSDSGIVAQVDGGGYGSTLITAGSTVLNNNNINVNAIITAAQGLTLGIHTVSIRSTSGSIDVYGVEILNQTNAIVVTPGTAYSNSQKVATATQQLVTYNANFTNVYGTAGNNGGHVLVYQNSSGAIKKDIQYTDTTNYLSSASHTNEEVARSYNVLEFSAGSSTDFSSFTGHAGSNKSFTLDDNTVTLLASDPNINSNGSLNCYSTNSYIVFTFIGTGLDIVRLDEGTINSSTLDTHTIYIDGNSVGTISGTSSRTVTTIASGLPYGTHTFKMIRSGGSSNFGVGIKTFTVYQPKIPSTPAGVTVLGDYNLLATYNSSNVTDTSTATGFLQVPAGAIYKGPSREFVYVGSSISLNGYDTTSPSGVNYTFPTAAGNTISYTFFGTGFMLLTVTPSATAKTFTVTIDGSLNSSGVAKTNAANSGAGVYTTTNSGPVRVEFTGLAVGWHTVVFARTSGASDLYWCGIHVISPIYSTQNKLAGNVNNVSSVGSNAINDARNITPVKNSTSSKNWSMAYAKAAAPTTSSTSSVPLIDMICTIQVKTGTRIRVSYSVPVQLTTSVNFASVQVFVNNVVQGSSKIGGYAATNSFADISDSFSFFVEPGTYTVALYWAGNIASTITSPSTYRSLLVEEI